LTWNSEIRGAGTFDFNHNLVLTKEGLTRTKWDLPDFFRKAKISYHSDNSWKDGYFQSANIGQEFVIQTNEEIKKWAKDLIKKYP